MALCLVLIQHVGDQMKLDQEQVLEMELFPIVTHHSGDVKKSPLADWGTELVLGLVAYLEVELEASDRAMEQVRVLSQSESLLEVFVDLQGYHCDMALNLLAAGVEVMVLFQSAKMGIYCSEGEYPSSVEVKVRDQSDSPHGF